MPTHKSKRHSRKIKGRWTLIPANHRAYVASHPLGLSVSIGLALGGFVNLIFPHLVMETSASLALPTPLFYLFSAMWALGGTLATLGLLRGRRNFEAGGMTLLAAALIVDYITVVSVRTTSALASVFIVFLAIGCAARARHLTRSGYVDVALPIEKR